MKTKVKGYTIEIVFHASMVFPPKLKKQVLKSVEQTLNALPVKLLNRHFKKGQPTNLNVSIVSRSTIRKLNKQYRNKDKATDVLSFSRLEGDKVVSALPDIGDVILCFDVAKTQAKEWGNTIPEEIRRLTVHGVLHIFGYDHERSKRDKKVMFALQEKILVGMQE